MKIKRYCLLLGTLACLPAFAQDYEIRLHRPMRVGDKYNFSSTGRQFEEMTMSAEGKMVRSNKTDATIQLESVVTVLAVSTNGKPIKQSLAVSKLTRTENGQFKMLVGGGSTVVAWHEGGKKMFTVNGGSAGRETSGALSIVVDLEKAGPTDDDLFGTRERKKVGDSWPADAKRMQEFLNEDTPLQTKGLVGKATLKEVLQEPGGPLLVVAAESTASVSPELPPGLVAEHATVTFRASSRFPVDTALGKPEDIVELTYSMRAKGKPQAGGPEMEMKVDARQSATMKRTFIR